MSVAEIYQAVRGRGFVSSKRCFSRDFLGRAANYASHMGLDRCSAGTLANLYRHLGEIGQADLQAMALQRLLNTEAREGSTEEAQP